MRLKRPDCLPQHEHGCGGRYFVRCYYPPHSRWYNLATRIGKARAIALADSMMNVEVKYPVATIELRALVCTHKDEVEIYANTKLQAIRRRFTG